MLRDPIANILLFMMHLEETTQDRRYSSFRHHRLFLYVPASDGKRIHTGYGLAFFNASIHYYPTAIEFRQASHTISRRCLYFDLL